MTEPVRWSPALSESQAILATIERVAGDKTIDIDRLERLIALQREILRDGERRAYNEAMASAQGELPQVVRDAENEQTKSWYASLEAIGRAADPIIAKHGFFQSFGSEDEVKPGTYRVGCLVGHRAGFERSYQADIPIDATGMKGTVNKTPTHAFKSTLSYGRVILTMMIFNIKSRKALPGDDGNAAGAAMPILAADCAVLEDLIAQTQTRLPSFLEYFRIADLSELPAKRFAEAVTILQRKLAKGAAK